MYYQNTVHKACLSNTEFATKHAMLDMMDSMPGATKTVLTPLTSEMMEHTVVRKSKNMEEVLVKLIHATDVSNGEVFGIQNAVRVTTTLPAASAHKIAHQAGLTLVYLVRSHIT